MIQLRYNVNLNPQILDTQDTFTIHVERDTFEDTYLEPYLLRARLDALGGRRLGRLGRACLRCHSSHSSSLASLLLLGWLGWFTGSSGGSSSSPSPGRRRPRWSLPPRPRLRLRGVAMTKQKMEELQGAGEDPLQHKEQMGGLIGALHTR
jgi:hypothetical protein